MKVNIRLYQWNNLQKNKFVDIGTLVIASPPKTQTMVSATTVICLVFCAHPTQYDVWLAYEPIPHGYDVIQQDSGT